MKITGEVFSTCALNAYDDEIAPIIKEKTEGYKSLEIEIGSGNGKFLVEHAQARDDVFFIGIEQSRKAIHKSISKTVKRDLKNIVFILGKAEKVIDEFLRDYTFDNVYLNFPDPWPKKKHGKRRILNEEFSIKVHSLLKNGGYFYCVTDDAYYATEVMSPILKKSTLFENALSSDWLHHLDGYIPTLYENKMRSAGKEIYYFCYKAV